MTLLTKDLLTQLSFGVHENKGVFALLLGSGLSRAAGLKTGWEITVDLVRRMGEAEGAKPDTDWVAWYRSATGEAPNYSRVLESLASTPAERRAILNAYIEPTDEEREEGLKVPTDAHHAIADLVAAGYVRVIVTTNFDRLFENALRERGVEPTVVASTDALHGAEPLVHSSCFVFKIHGDYKDARILNTSEELHAYPDDFDRLLDQIFNDFGLIVCGWSGEWDHALREALVRAPNQRYPMYWATRGELGEGARNLIAHRRAFAMSIEDADRFFNALRDRVETLETARRHNPATTELLIATLKRFMPRPQFRIQRDDLVAEESERLLATLGELDCYRSHREDYDEEIRERIQTLEAETERVMKMAGVLGRWGDGSDLEYIVDLICSINKIAESRRVGMRDLLELQSYPAILVMTFYGVGLVRSERWQTLHDLFTSRIYDDQTLTSRQLIELFNFWDWAGSDQRIWHLLPDLANWREALSKHLGSLIRSGGAAFVAGTPDIGALQGYYELLAAIALSESVGSEDLSVALEKRHSPGNAHLVPPGHYVLLDSNNVHRLFAHLRTPRAQESLLNAGFAHGEKGHLELSFRNYERVVAMVRSPWWQY